MKNIIMKKAGCIACLLFCTTFILSACSAKQDSEKTTLNTLNTLAPESELVITASDTQVSDFLKKNTDFTSGYETDECYNITPDFVAAHSGYSVFKYSTSTESFIMYDDEIYSIGSCFGGNGITSMALADLNQDGNYELYYTFSWGSGEPRSEVGYFEPVNKEIHVFKYENPLCEMILTVNSSGDLCVNTAALDMDDSVNFKIEAKDFVGTIGFEENQIVLNIAQQD